MAGLILAALRRNDLYYRGDKASAEYIQQQFAALPGITNQLFDYLKFSMSFNTEEWEYQADDSMINVLLHGLRLRKDLSASQVKWISDLLLDYAKKKYESRYDVDRNFLASGVLLLQDYPTTENEDVVLELLNDIDDSLQRNSLKTLQKIGTARSLPALEKKADWFKTGSGYQDEEVLQVIQTITIREKLKNQASQSDRNPNNSTLKPNHATSNASSPSSPSSRDSSFSFWWIFWAIAIVMVVRILWKLIRTLYDSF